VFSGWNNNWIIISVLLPGTVFYISFMVLYTIFDIQNDSFSKLNENQAFTIAIIAASGLIVQLFGMIFERIGFDLWHYLQLGVRDPEKYKLKKEQEKKYLTHKYWKKRYDVMPQVNENPTLERIIAQFFMAHNISIGFGITFWWVLTYLVIENKFFENWHVLCIIVVLLGASIIVAQLRFKAAKDSLFEVAYKKKIFVTIQKNITEF